MSVVKLDFRKAQLLEARQGADSLHGQSDFSLSHGSDTAIVIDSSIQDNPLQGRDCCKSVAHLSNGILIESKDGKLLE
jgi:hypothetical protein